MPDNTLQEKVDNASNAVQRALDVDAKSSIIAEMIDVITTTARCVEKLIKLDPRITKTEEVQRACLLFQQSRNIMLIQQIGEQAAIDADLAS
jgi:hypothetical protein